MPLCLGDSFDSEVVAPLRLPVFVSIATPRQQQLTLARADENPRLRCELLAQIAAGGGFGDVATWQQAPGGLRVRLGGAKLAPSWRVLAVVACFCKLAGADAPGVCRGSGRSRGVGCADLRDTSQIWGHPPPPRHATSLLRTWAFVSHAAAVQLPPCRCCCCRCSHRRRRRRHRRRRHRPRRRRLRHSSLPPGRRRTTSRAIGRKDAAVSVFQRLSA